MRYKKGLWNYLLLVSGIVFLAGLGYGGFRLYPHLGLPSTMGVWFLLLAVLAGVASLFSPCSFPLLITLLGREVNATEEEQPSRRLFGFSISFAFGAALFLLLTGAALALGAAPLFARITFTSVPGRLLRTAVGLLLILLGVWPVRGRSLNFAWLDTLLQPLWQTQARLRRQHSTLSSGLYGFGYVLAGFG